MKEATKYSVSVCSSPETSIISIVAYFRQCIMHTTSYIGPLYQVREAIDY